MHHLEALGKRLDSSDAEVRREGETKPLALFRCTQMLLYPK